MTVHIIGLTNKVNIQVNAFFMLFTNVIITSFANSNLSTFFLPNLT